LKTENPSFFYRKTLKKWVKLLVLGSVSECKSHFGGEKICGPECVSESKQNKQILKGTGTGTRTGTTWPVACIFAD
jgi:hypothetical protein